MLKTDKGLIVLLFLTLLSGCAAMGVPYTNNPAEKLRWAVDLLDKQNRPLPAEWLIQEAIVIYKSDNDDMGLADAYRVYGYFFALQPLAIGENIMRSMGS